MDAPRFLCPLVSTAPGIKAGVRGERGMEVTGGARAKVEKSKEGDANAEVEVEMGIEAGNGFSEMIYLDKFTTLSREEVVEAEDGLKPGTDTTEGVVMGEGARLVFGSISLLFVFSVSASRTLKFAISSKFTGLAKGIGRVREVEGVDKDGKGVRCFV